MRQALLIPIFLVVVVAGLMHPEAAILGYVWFALMRPDLLAWSPLPYSFVLAVVTLLSSLRYAPRFTVVFRNPIALLLVLIQIPVLISMVLAVRPELTYDAYNVYGRVILMSLLIPVLIFTELWLHRLLTVMIFSMGLLAFKFGLWSALGGGVKVKGLGGLIGDSNGLALAMGMTVPLLWFARNQFPKWWVKVGILSAAAFAVLTIIMTGSRGNAVAAGCVAFVIIMRTKHKIPGLIGITLLMIPGLFLGGSMWVDRMATIENYEEDQSAKSRLIYADVAIRMWLDYPIFGVGFGENNYVALSSRYLGEDNPRKVHNTYLQILVDSGIFAFLLYVALLWGSIVWLQRSSARMKRQFPDRQWIPLALQGSLIHFALASAFYSRGDFDYCYIVLMTAAAWYEIEKQLVAAPPAKEVPKATTSIPMATFPSVRVRPTSSVRRA